VQKRLNEVATFEDQRHCVLDGGPDPHGEEKESGGGILFIVKYENIYWHSSQITSTSFQSIRGFSVMTFLKTKSKTLLNASVISAVHYDVVNIPLSLGVCNKKNLKHKHFKQMCCL